MYVHNRVKSRVLISQFIMKLFWALIFAVFYNGYLSEGVNSTLSSTMPGVVNIGCILTFNSDVGKVTKVAVEAAVEDVNSDPTVLGGTKLNISMLDSNSSGFLGIVEGKFTSRPIYLPIQLTSF